MSVNTCKCVLPLGNTGRPDSVTLPGLTKMWIAVAMQDGDGNHNFINLDTDTLDQAFFDAKVNHVDPLKRWYPISDVEAITNERALPNTETIGNRTQNVEQGARAVSASIYERGAVFAGKLAQNSCTKFGLYYVDICPNLTGTYVVTATEKQLRPIAVDNRTWSVTEFFASDSGSPRVQVNYLYGDLEVDSEFRTIEADEMGGVNLLDLDGLTDLNTVVSSISLTSHTVAITRDYFKGKAESPYVGLVAVDLALAEITPTPGAIAIISSVESDPGVSGVYAITYALATAGDVIETTLAVPGKYEMEETRHTAAV